MNYFLSTLNNNKKILSVTEYYPYEDNKLTTYINEICNNNQKLIEDLSKQISYLLLNEAEFNGITIDYLSYVHHTNSKYDYINKVLTKKVSKITNIKLLKYYLEPKKSPYIDQVDLFHKYSPNDITNNSEINNTEFNRKYFIDNNLKNIVIFDFIVSSGQIFNDICNDGQQKDNISGFITFRVRIDADRINNSFIINKIKCKSDFWLQNDDFQRKNNLTKIKIERIFGKDNLEVDFTNRANIIIGENGIGKSTSLKIIDSVLNKNYLNLQKFYFEKIIVTDNGQDYIIKYYDLIPKFSKESKFYDFFTKLNDYEYCDLIRNIKNKDEGIKIYIIKLLRKVRYKISDELITDLINELNINLQQFKEHFDISIYNSYPKYESFFFDGTIKRSILPSISEMEKEFLNDDDYYLYDSMNEFDDSYESQEESTIENIQYVPYEKDYDNVEYNPYHSDYDYNLDDVESDYYDDDYDFDSDDYQPNNDDYEEDYPDPYDGYEEYEDINLKYHSRNIAIKRKNYFNKNNFEEILKQKKIKIRDLIFSNYYIYETSRMRNLIKILNNIRDVLKVENAFFKQFIETEEGLEYIYKYIFEENFYILDYCILNIRLNKGLEINQNVKEKIKSLAYESKFNYSEMNGKKFTLGILFEIIIEFKRNMVLNPVTTNKKIIVLNQLLNKYFYDKKAVIYPNVIMLTKDGNVLPIDKLSSGETNLIILLSAALLGKPDFILLDEPEISSSISWKSSMIVDILKNTDSCIIASTHSPSIIDDNGLNHYLSYIKSRD